MSPNNNGTNQQLITFTSIEEIKQYEKTQSEKKGTKQIIALFGNDVIDATSFFDEHPGGPDLITDFAGGKDMKDDYEATGHSSDADKTLNSLKIGVLASSASAAPKKKEKEEQSSKDIMLYVGLVTAVISVALGIVLLKKKSLI